MSLIPPSTLYSGPISLSLFKLSFCTTPLLRANLVWTHLPQRDNLFAVFDYVPRKDVEGFTTEKKILKLMRGGDLLEQVELDNLALQARLDEERNRSQLLEDADRYVILLVKRPLLAMRYQLPNGQIRRVQMNFQPDSGYDNALNALQNLGLPIRDKSQPAVYPTSAAPRMSQHHQHVPPSQPTTRLLPSPEFNYRPSTSNGFEHRPSSSAPETPCERPWTAPDPVSFSQTLPPRREIPLAMQRTLDQKWPPKRMSPARPQPPTEPTLPDFGHRAPASTPPTPSPDPLQDSRMLPPGRRLPLEGQSHSITLGVASQTHIVTPETSKPSVSGPTQSAVKPPAKRKSRAKPKAAKKPASNRDKGSQVAKSDDPSIVSGESGKETLQTALSAFNAPKRMRSRAKGVVSRDLCTDADEPMLNPLSTMAANDAALQVSATRLSSNSAPPIIDQASNTTTAHSQAERPKTINTADTSTQTSQSRGLLVLRPGRKAMAEILGNSKGRPLVNPDTSSTPKEPASKYPSLAGTNEVSPEEFMSQLHNFVRYFQDVPAPTPRPTDFDQLAAYAAQSDEVRQAVVRDMIFEYLGDENFVRLAEDVEKEWRRIGLGF